MAAGYRVGDLLMVVSCVDMVGRRKWSGGRAESQLGIGRCAEVAHAAVGESGEAVGEAAMIRDHFDVEAGREQALEGNHQLAVAGRDHYAVVVTVRGGPVGLGSKDLVGAVLSTPAPMGDAGPRHLNLQHMNPVAPGC